MANKNQPTGLSTEPVTATPKKRAGKKAISKGDPVLIHIKQHHGLHGVVVNELGNNQYVVRGNEQAIEGTLFQFSGDQLEPATAEHLAIENNHERLYWDYED